MGVSGRLRGRTVILDVDGGKGGDLADVLCTISAIGTALAALKLDYPRAHAVIVAYHRDGASLRAQAKAAGMAHATMSGELARGEAYLVGVLKGARVVG